MAKDIENKSERMTASVRTVSYRQAQIAASLTGENLTDFVSTAIQERAEPILRKHKVKLPDDAAPVSQAAAHGRQMKEAA